ncbi:MAG: hypothetical protein GY757_19160 [bacterium]|nr:hypothetical protein [bacterium]
MELMKTPFAVTDPAIMAAAQTAKAEVETRYQMALYQPRKEEQARHDILRACNRLEFAKAARYRKPVGGRQITGLTIRAAEYIALVWCHIGTNVSVIYDKPDAIRYQVSTTDYQSNVNDTRSFEIAKTVERKDKRDRVVLSERMNKKGEIIYIVLATEAELSNKAGTEASKLKRNQILAMIPPDLKTEMEQTCVDVVRKNIDADPDAAKKDIIDWFRKINISPTEIEKYLKHSLSTITAKEIADLTEVWHAINLKERTWQDFLEPDKEAGPVDKTPKNKKSGGIDKTPKPKKAAKRPTPKAEPVSASIEVTPVELLSAEDLDIFVTIDIANRFINSEIFLEFKAYAGKFDPHVIQKFQGYRVETSQEFANLKVMIADASKGI